ADTGGRWNLAFCPRIRRANGLRPQNGSSERRPLPTLLSTLGLTASWRPQYRGDRQRTWLAKLGQCCSRQDMLKALYSPLSGSTAIAPKGSTDYLFPPERGRQVRRSPYLSVLGRNLPLCKKTIYQ